MALEKPIVVGLNGAWQRRIALGGELQVGAVNRAVEASSGPGGKGQGAWLATERLGLGARLAQFVGAGDEGISLAQALRDRGKDDEALWVTVASRTRVCSTLVTSDGEATEIVEPSGVVEPAELEQMYAALQPTNGLLFMGSMPPGVPKDAYAKIAQVCSSTDTKVLIDSVVGLEDLLRQLSSSRSVVLKVNARELAGLCCLETHRGSDSASAIDASALGTAVAENEMLKNLAFALWTDGPFAAGAFDFATRKQWRYRMPALPGPVVSPIGAGDAVAGATFAAWLNPQGDSDDVPEVIRAFGRGLSCGAASCLTPENARFDLDVADKIHSDIHLEQHHTL